MSDKHTIVEADQIGMSSGVPLLHEAMHEIMQSMTEHWPQNTYPVNLTDPAIIAVDRKSNDIVGLLVYRSVSSRTVEITLAYVEASSRRQGVLTQMFEHLKWRNRQNGRRRIELTTRFNNPEMTHAAVALKLVPYVKTYAQEY